MTDLTDPPWLMQMEAEERVEKMTREQLAAHLAIQGWHPVKAKTATLVRGFERVSVVAFTDCLITQYHALGARPDRIEVSWHAVKHAHLIMMAKRLLQLEYVS